MRGWLQKNHSGLPEKILVTDDLPDDKWHGWKWLRHDIKGDLYTNVGAPCNICLSENPQYASILSLVETDGSMLPKVLEIVWDLTFIPSHKNYFLLTMGVTGWEMTALHVS